MMNRALESMSALELGAYVVQLLSEKQQLVHDAAVQINTLTQQLADANHKLNHQRQQVLNNGIRYFSSCHCYIIASYTS